MQPYGVGAIPFGRGRARGGGLPHRQFPPFGGSFSQPSPPMGLPSPPQPTRATVHPSNLAPMIMIPPPLPQAVLPPPQQMFSSSMVPHSGPPLMPSMYPTASGVIGPTVGAFPPLEPQACEESTAVENAEDQAALNDNGQFKRKLHLRKAGGEVWSDSTLDDWPEEDFR